MRDQPVNVCPGYSRILFYIAIYDPACVCVRVRRAKKSVYICVCIYIYSLFPLNLRKERRRKLYAACETRRSGIVTELTFRSFMKTNFSQAR